MFSDSIVFLGGSQTFVGVLATVIVMCVLVGENNFIYQILKLIKKQMADSLEDVSAVVNFDRLNNDTDYKYLKVLIETKRLTDGKDIIGGELLKKTISWKSNFQVENAKPEMSGEDIEISFASLYSFLFVLVVFLFDELLRSTLIPYKDFLVSILSFFTFLSSLYWLGKWIVYVIDIWRNNGYRTYILPSDSRFSKMMQSFHDSFIENDWLRYSLEFLFFIIFAFVVCIFGIEGIFMPLILTTMGVLVPFIFEGIFHLTPEKKIEDSSDKGYRSALNHVGRMLLLSVLLSSIYILLGSTSLFGDLLIPYESLCWLKFFSVGFVIMNGLVIPSVVPFHTYRHLSNLMRRKPQRMQRKVDSDIDELLAEIKRFTKLCNE